MGAEGWRCLCEGTHDPGCPWDDEAILVVTANGGKCFGCGESRSPWAESCPGCGVTFTHVTTPRTRNRADVMATRPDLVWKDHP